MLAIAEVMRAASLVVRWAMAPPMVQPMGIRPITMSLRKVTNDGHANARASP